MDVWLSLEFTEIWSPPFQYITAKLPFSEIAKIRFSLLFHSKHRIPFVFENTSKVLSKTESSNLSISSNTMIWPVLVPAIRCLPEELIRKSDTLSAEDNS